MKNLKIPFTLSLILTCNFDPNKPNNQFQNKYVS
jgi:hypothetical protein